MRRADKALSGLIDEMGRPENHAEGILLFDALRIRNDRLRRENDLLRDAWQYNGTELKALKTRHEAIVDEFGKLKALLDGAYRDVIHWQSVTNSAKTTAEHMRGLLATAREREATAQAQALDMTRIIDGLRADVDAAVRELAQLRRPLRQPSAVLRERGRWIDMGETE